jgi:hypothetical protein
VVEIVPPVAIPPRPKLNEFIVGIIVVPVKADAPVPPDWFNSNVVN